MKHFVYQNVAMAILLAGGSLAMSALASAPVGAIESSSVCSDSISQSLYKTKYFYRGSKKLNTAQLKVYKVKGNSGEYCVTAFSWSGSVLKGVEISKYKRSTTTSQWSSTGYKDTNYSKSYVTYHTVQTSKLKGVSYGFVADDSNGTRYYAFSPILTKR